MFILFILVYSLRISQLFGLFFAFLGPLSFLRVKFLTFFLKTFL